VPVEADTAAAPLPPPAPSPPGLVAAPRPPRALGPVHWRGIATLVRRELARHLRFWPESVIGPAVSMLLYLLVFALALGPDRATAEGEAVLTFIAPGLVLFSIMMQSGQAITFSLIFDKLEGMIADLLAAPLMPSELAAAHAAAGALAGLVTGTPVLLALIPVLGLAPVRPLLALAVAALSALMMALFGLLAGLWAKKWDHVAAVYGFAVLPVAFLSGLFAPADALPAPLDTAVRASPLFYALDAFRGAVTGAHAAPLWLSLAVLGGTTALLWLACNRLVRRGYSLKS